MIVSNGIVAVVAAGMAMLRMRLRGFGFLEGVFSGIVVSLVLFWALLFTVVIGGP